MVHYIQEGNIFKIPQVRNYAHGCNCSGATGKGIALQFKDKFPEMFEQYKALCKDNKYNVGDVFQYQYKDGFVYNLGTQKTWWDKAELEYIETSLHKMLEMAENEGVKEIAMPAIGAGLGGISWDDIKPLISKVASNHPTVDLYVVERSADVETKVCYIRKYWEEENVMYYLHFVGENAVRQIEIEPDETIYLSTDKPIYEDYSLYDQDLSSLDLTPEEFITKEEFEKVWHN